MCIIYTLKTEYEKVLHSAKDRARSETQVFWISHYKPMQDTLKFSWNKQHVGNSTMLLWVKFCSRTSKFTHTNFICQNFASAKKSAQSTIKRRFGESKRQSFSLKRWLVYSWNHSSIFHLSSPYQHVTSRSFCRETRQVFNNSQTVPHLFWTIRTEILVQLLQLAPKENPQCKKTATIFLYTVFNIIYFYLIFSAIS